MNWSPFKSLHRDIYFVSWELFKIMIPTLLVVKLFDMAGGVAALAWALAQGYCPGLLPRAIAQSYNPGL